MEKSAQREINFEISAKREGSKQQEESEGSHGSRVSSVRGVPKSYTKSPLVQRLVQPILSAGWYEK